MSLRTVLIALIVAATGAFVVGAALERNTGESGHEHRAEPARSTTEGGAEEPHSEAGEQASSRSGESAEQRGAEAAGESSTGEKHEELRPLGINVEAWPFVTLAALAFLALAAAGWLRSQSLAILLAVAAAMLVFAALDLREVFHQVDEDHTGLAALAAAVAALHAGAGAVALALVLCARRAPHVPGTMPA